jgi:hypothetical protein
MKNKKLKMDQCFYLFVTFGIDIDFVYDLSKKERTQLVKNAVEHQKLVNDYEKRTTSKNAVNKMVNHE